MTARVQGIHPVLMAAHVAASVAFYRGLGFSLVFADRPDHPGYAVVARDGVELHLQWADAQQWAYPVDRPVYRLMVNDVDALFQEFVAGGAIDRDATEASPWAAPAETPWGTREFHLRDPGRNILQFYQRSDPSQAL